MKYGNRKTVVDGIVFDSVKESRYYMHLKLMEKAGYVVKIQRQVPFILQDGFRKGGKAIRPIKYIADFVVEYADGHTEVIDVKGCKTDVYLLKKKLFEYKYHNMTIVEV